MSEYRRHALATAFVLQHPDPWAGAEQDCQSWIDSEMTSSAGLSLGAFHRHAMSLAPAGYFQSHLRFDVPAEAIAALSQEIMAAMKKTLDDIAALRDGPIEQLTWDTVLQPLGTAVLCRLRNVATHVCL